MATSLLHSEFVRVNEKCPCPICGRADWCMISKDGKVAICPRTPSDKRWGDVGFLHTVTKKCNVSSPSRRVVLSSQAVQRYLDKIGRPPAHLLKQHSALLGISIPSLEFMDVYYDASEAVLVFPMRNAQRKLVGVRKRRRDGRKWALKGGREGLFFGLKTMLNMPLLVTEGPTDAAACVEAGLWNVIGRSNCFAGLNHIDQLMLENQNTPLILTADPDEVGIDYGKALASKCKSPMIVIAGPSDVRNFVKAPRTDFFKEVCAALESDSEHWRVVYRNMRAVSTPNDKIIKALEWCRNIQ